MQELNPQIENPLLLISEEQKHRKKEKRGRKAISMTIALSKFSAKNGKEPPRKEFLRCCIFRKMFKMIKSILNDRAKIILHPSYALLCIYVKTNSDHILAKIDKQNLPYVENKTNMIYKSYSNSFCKVFFDDLLMRQIFETFIDVIFGDNNLKKLQSSIRVYCCKGACANENSCRVNFEWLKLVILEDFLR